MLIISGYKEAGSVTLGYIMLIHRRFILLTSTFVSTHIFFGFFSTHLQLLGPFSYQMTFSLLKMAKRSLLCDDAAAIPVKKTKRNVDDSVSGQTRRGGRSKNFNVPDPVASLRGIESTKAQGKKSS